MRRIAAATLILLASACATSNISRPDAYINRVWRVAAGSDIPAGAYYVFLAEGDVLITSPTGTPSLGRWRPSTNSSLDIFEEGQRYRTRIVELNDRTFVIEMENPGATTRIVFERVTGR